MRFLAGLAGASTRDPRALVPIAMVVWAAVVVAVAGRGGFAATGPPVATVAAVALPIAAVATAYLTVAAVRTWVSRFDVAAVLAFQAWRVIGVAFLFGWLHGDLPASFAIPAAIGDLATGVAAVPTAIAATRGRLTPRGLAGFTALGIGDFLVAIVAGVALQPVALETLPWVLFPALAVPVFVILHVAAIVVFRDGR